MATIRQKRDLLHRLCAEVPDLADRLVTVVRSPRDWCAGTVRFESIDDPRYSSFLGGVRAHFSEADALRLHWVRRDRRRGGQPLVPPRTTASLHQGVHPQVAQRISHVPHSRDGCAGRVRPRHSEAHSGRPRKPCEAGRIPKSNLGRGKSGTSVDTPGHTRHPSIEVLF